MARVCMGGTFDVVHKGHRALLRTAFREGDEGVFVGVTTDRMASDRRDRVVFKHEERKAGVETFLEEQGWLDRAEVAPIDDPVGRALEPIYDTIVVSTETRGGAEYINERRRAKGLDPLRVVTAPLVLADDGRRISATRIRDDEIDADGRLLRALRAVVGSGNPVKVDAVRHVLEDAWPQGSAVEGRDVGSGVDEQPHGGVETVRGALARAQRALDASDDADWGVGVEAGLVGLSGWHRMLDVQVCAIVDRGGRVSLGHGPGFPHPPVVLDAVEEGRTVGEAMDALAGEDDVGRRMGAIGVLSKGAMDRRELTEAAVLMALLPRLNPDLYELPRLDDPPLDLDG